MAACCHAAQPAVPADPAAKAAQPPAEAVQYRELAVDMTQRNNQSKIRGILRAGKFGPGEKEFVRAYYETYALTRWSVRKYIASLQPVFRKDLRTDLGQGRGETHDYVNDLALKTLEQLSKNDPTKLPWHPAVRVNAMLAIGDLNATEASPTTPPQPLAAALPVLTAAVDDKDQLPAVKVVALVGILRHLKMGGVRDPAERKSVATASFRVASAPGPTSDGDGWMRAQAADILGELGMVGSNGAVPTALAAVVSNPKMLFSARCAAARALGQLDYQGSGSVSTADMLRVLKALVQLAIDACNAERAPVSRQRLKARLLAIEDGLSGADDRHKGVAPLATDAAQQKLLGGLRPSLQKLVAALDDRRADDAALLKTTRDAVADLQRLLKAAP